MLTALEKMDFSGFKMMDAGFGEGHRETPGYVSDIPQDVFKIVTPEAADVGLEENPDTGVVILSTPHAVGDITYVVTDEYGQGGASTWSGSYWYCDVDKTEANTDDDLMCWAATVANMLMWTGWDGGYSSEEEIFQQFLVCWDDEGGFADYGLDWWFYGEQGPFGGGSSQLNNQGKQHSGYYNDETGHYGLSYDIDTLDEALDSGKIASLSVYDYTGGYYVSHAITCWGYEKDARGYLTAVYVSDSDDYVDSLQRYELTYDADWDAYFFDDYFGWEDLIYIGDYIWLDINDIPEEGCKTCDLDGNGNSDILFTNDSNRLGYYADGNSSNWNDLGSHASGWSIDCIADFDGDGSSDVLFTNNSNQIGYYGGGDPANWNDLGGYAAGWSINGTGDFDGDGNSDVLFTNDSNQIGYYGGGSSSNWTDLGGYAAGWEVSGTGDFNGDGTSDVLFTNNSNQIGYYGGGSSSNWTDLGGYAAGWDIAGIGDFNGDGTSDVLFTNDNNQLGYYGGGNSANWVDLGSYAAGWDVEFCADFNGNGKDDILFSNSSNQIGYYADGLPSNWNDLGSYASGWQVVVA